MIKFYKLRRKFMTNKNQTVVSTFYKFFDFPCFETAKEPLKQFCENQELKGTILLADEGINSTISGSRDGLDNLYKYLHDHLGIDLDNIKESTCPQKPFGKMKVRLKEEIVTLRAGRIDVNSTKGEYIEPQYWDEFISRDDVVLIDTRNQYEINLGTFEGAIDPETQNFRDFPAWLEGNREKLVGKKVAMCCTGGVRCEKSTAFMKKEGFEEVYHLKGGIINYFQKTENKAGKWKGKLFVFDDRFIIDEQLQQNFDIKCTKCHNILTTDDAKRSGKSKILYCKECQHD